MTEKRIRIIPAYAAAPLLCLCLAHAAVWLGTKAVADYSRARDVTLAIDALIPLRPEWVVIYSATFLFWIMGLYVISRQDEERCCRFVAGVIFAELICCFIFIAFPSCITRPEIEPDGVFTWALSIVYALDTPTNCFPSMHCLLSWLVFRQALRSPRAKPGYKLFCGVFTALVCLSTLFVKQHAVADVAGGLIFGELAFILGQKLPLWKFFIKINKKVLHFFS